MIEHKPLYSIAELADLFRLHRNSVARLLEAAGVTITRAGNRKYVALAEIESKLPEVWRSVWMLSQDE